MPLGFVFASGWTGDHWSTIKRIIDGTQSSMAALASVRYVCTAWSAKLALRTWIPHIHRTRQHDTVFDDEPLASDRGT